jgi:hypothetical protein
MRLPPLLVVVAILSDLAACTPEIGTDPTPEVMEFDPSSTPPRVSEPSFAVVNPATMRIDLGLAGIDVPMDCQNQTAMTQAQCEFNQYLESLSGFPTATSARAPVSAEVDLATTMGNVSVVAASVAAATAQPMLADVSVGFDQATRYLQVATKKSWPVGSFVWMGVRGYERGIRAGGKPVVASVIYNLLKREREPDGPAQVLTCGATSADAIDATCPYLDLLSQQMSVEAARASLVRLESLRQAMITFRGWELMEAVGGIPKAEVAMLWGFPVHRAPVIDLNPKTGLQPQVTAADELRLAVNGEVDAATIQAFRIGNPGTVYFVNLTALAAGDLAGGFPAVTASVSGGAIVIKGSAPFERGKTYGIFVTRGAKTTMGTALVPPPISVLLMSRGKLSGSDGKSTVSSVSDEDALLLELGRQQLAMLLDSNLFVSVTGLEREDIAYLFAFPLGAP